MGTPVFQEGSQVQEKGMEGQEGSAASVYGLSRNAQQRDDYTVYSLTASRSRAPAGAIEGVRKRNTALSGTRHIFLYM